MPGDVASYALTWVSRSMNGFCFPQGLLGKLLALSHVAKATVSNTQVGQCYGDRDVVWSMDVPTNL